MNHPLHARLEKELLHSQFKITFAQDLVDDLSLKGWKVRGNAWDLNGQVKDTTQSFDFAPDFQDAQASCLITLEDDCHHELCVCISSAKGYRYCEKVLPVYINGTHLFANIELHDDTTNPEKHQKKLSKICKRLNKLIANYLIGIHVSDDLRNEISTMVDKILENQQSS